MDFSIEKKGYNVTEVNSYVEDLELKIARLQAQNSELEQKLATAKRLIRRFSDTENALKQNIADSKRAAAYMISDAKDRSEELLDSARESCGEIISDLDMQISERMTTVGKMRDEVTAFKDELFALYSSHIELIDRIAGFAENFEYQPDYTLVAEAVDNFEEADLPDCQIPEFVEYPEESIFAEISEDEDEDSEEFVIVNNELVADNEEEIVFETVEEVINEESVDDGLDQIAFGEESFDSSDVEDDIPEFEAIAYEEEAEEELNIDETDYFKFLADFAASEDEIDN